MNRRQIEIQKVHIANEEQVIKQLKQVYIRARRDCARKIHRLSSRTDMENLQSIVFQKQYQEVLANQINSILDTLNNNSFMTITDYLTVSYEDGFLGTLYDLQGQGIPLIFPIDQEAAVRALQVDSKISQGLYRKMGEDTDKLKEAIRNELSRGTANGENWNQIAARIADGMNSPFPKAYNRALTIVRTEGHRVCQEAAYHCQQRAKAKGADVVKQWCSTLDGVTRPNHVALDNQVREVEEPFEVAGKKAMYPGAFGDPSEDCNCRCCVNQRARWGLSEEEFITKWDGDKKELVKIRAKSYDEFKQKYLNLHADADTIKSRKILHEPVRSKDKYIDMLLSSLKSRNVAYNPIRDHISRLNDEEIILALSGGDRTSGSCASLGLAYIGQKQGWDVLDFRGGESQKFFSTTLNLIHLSKSERLKVLTAEGETALTVGDKLLKQCEVGKEYYLKVGRHVAIVRKLENGKLQYLELQSAQLSGWTDFNENPRYTLMSRFGCSFSLPSAEEFMIDIDESDFGTDDFKSLLGYINTEKAEQKKGKDGTIK